MKIKRIYKILIAILILLVIIGWFGLRYSINNILPYSSIRPHRVTQEEISNLSNIGFNPSALGVKYTSFDVTLEDSISLKCWLIPSKADYINGNIVLLHGIASCKESLLKISDTLSGLGFNCIIYDSRGHGESGGINCTFGYYEKRDLTIIIDSVSKKFPNNKPFGIYGYSLGAAVAIQAMEIDKRIECGVVVSPFATLREVIYDYWNSISPLHFKWIPDEALKKSESIANFKVDSVKPEESAKHIDRPVLVIHGVDDKKISISYGRRVYDNLKNPHKKWYPVIGANHDNIENIGGKAFITSIVEFFKKNLR